MGRWWATLEMFDSLAFMLILAVRSSAKDRTSTGQTGQSLGGRPLSNLVVYKRKRQLGG